MFLVIASREAFADVMCPRTVQKVVTSDISARYHYHDFMGSLPNFIILGYVLGHVGQHHRHF